MVATLFARIAEDERFFRASRRNGVPQTGRVIGATAATEDLTEFSLDEPPPLILTVLAMPPLESSTAYRSRLVDVGMRRARAPWLKALSEEVPGVAKSCAFREINGVSGNDGVGATGLSPSPPPPPHPTREKTVHIIAITIYTDRMRSLTCNILLGNSYLPGDYRASATSHYTPSSGIHSTLFHRRGAEAQRISVFY